jgi:DNA-binding MarR family transcriptional regulator
VEHTAGRLKDRVILGARQYGISTVLFRALVAEQLGLNVTDLECLALLFHKRISSPSEMARHTGLSSGATTAMLDRLERARLIKRRPNPDDRRGTLVVLNRAGADKIGPWFTSIRQAQEKIVSGYTEAQLGVLDDFFTRSEAAWENERKQLKAALGPKQRGSKGRS